MIVTFHDVEIVMEAATPKEAYIKLSNVLIGFESMIRWSSKTYSAETPKASTKELF